MATEPATESERNTAEPRLVEVRLSALRPNPHQPRKTFREEALRELADSMARNGLIQPIVVIGSEDAGYTLVAGERRFRAAKLLDWDTIPTVVLAKGNSDELALIENVQREDLHPLEEAEAMAGLMERYKYTQEQLAGVVGKARPTVTNTLKLNTLPDQIKQESSTSYLASKSLLLEIAQLPEEQQLPFWKEVKGGKMTVRAARRKKAGEAVRSRPPVELTLTAGRTFLKRLRRLAKAEDLAIDQDQIAALTQLRDKILQALSSREDRMPSGD